MSEKNVNRAIEYIKLIAACFVVFIHIRFPGMFGRIMDGIARFAVPFFFAVSGYFSYQIGSQAIKKRIAKIIKLILIATLLYVFFDIFMQISQLKGTVSQYLLSKFNLKNIAKWLFMNLHPIRGHLWYLSAILTCYAMFWIYIKLNKKNEQLITYQPLYICGFLLLMMHIMWSLKATGINMKISYQMYRIFNKK